MPANVGDDGQCIYSGWEERANECEGGDTVGGAVLRGLGAKAHGHVSTHRGGLIIKDLVAAESIDAQNTFAPSDCHTLREGFNIIQTEKTTRPSAPTDYHVIPSCDLLCRARPRGGGGVSPARGSGLGGGPARQRRRRRRDSIRPSRLRRARPETFSGCGHFFASSPGVGSRSTCSALPPLQVHGAFLPLFTSMRCANHQHLLSMRK